MGKKFYFSLLLLCIYFFSCEISRADYQQNTSKQIIKIGYLPGFGFVRDMDSLDSKGYLYEIFKRIEQYSNYNFSFIPYASRKAMLTGLESKEVDIIGPIAYIPELAKKYSYTHNPLGQAQAVLVSKQKNTPFYYNDPVSINGKVVASFHGSPFEKLLDAYCQRHDISVTYVHGDITNFQNLEADLYLTSTVFDAFQKHTSILNLSTYDYYLLFLKENTHLNDLLHEAYAKTINADGKLLHDLFIKYYNNPSLVRRHLTRDETHILRDKHFNVGYVHDHRPFQFTNEKGEPDGILIEIFNLLATKYGFTFSYTPYSLTENPENHKDFDILISLTGKRQQENQWYNPTESYISLPMMLYADKRTAKYIDFSKDQKNIATLQYLSLNNDAIKELYPQANIIPFDSFASVFKAYNEGKLDALISTTAGSVYLDILLGHNVYTYSTGIDLPAKLLISKKLPSEYITMFNIIFDHISPGVFDEIIARHTLRYVPSYSTADILQRYMVEIILFILAMSAISAIIFLATHNKKNKDIVNLIKYDKLTGFYNYTYFSEKAKNILKNAKPQEYELVSIDIDNFKTIINYFSYAKGTQVLLAVAKGLENALQGQEFLITRPHADSFLILRKHQHNRNLLHIINQYLLPPCRAVLKEGYDLHFSMGAFVIKDFTGRISFMVDKANLARKKGKDEHESTFYYFDASMEQDFADKLSVTFRMEKALLNREFKVIYQPKIDLKTLRVQGAEALVRWIPRGEPTIYPSVFIPIFEHNGFIAKLDLYVFAEVCKFIKDNSKNMQVPLISANLSARTMLEENIVQKLVDIIQDAGIAPQRVELEITESAMVNEGAMEIVSHLKKIGFVISIDDFGAGSSSLNRLGTVEAEVVKLDKAFLDFSSQNKRNEIVVKNTIDMAKDLQMKTVAEGVETVDQARWLQSLGCQMVQGYYFERPMPEEDFIHILRIEKIYTLG